MSAPDPAHIGSALPRGAFEPRLSGSISGSDMRYEAVMALLQSIATLKIIHVYYDGSREWA
jgi:hypothetical protein